MNTEIDATAKRYINLANDCLKLHRPDAVDTLANAINETLLLRNVAGVSANELAAAFRARDKRRHCGVPDMSDEHDREAVAAFVEGAIFILNGKK